MELKKLTERISELSRKSKVEDLTPEEKKEQEELRRDYIDRYKNNLRAQLEEMRPGEADKKNKMLKGGI